MPNTPNPAVSQQCTACLVYAHEPAAATACVAAAHTWEDLHCVDSGLDSSCGGDRTEYCFGYGLKGSYTRCGVHFAAYMERAEKINRRYPDSPIPPADFDPTYAGERWNDDY